MKRSARAASSRARRRSVRRVGDGEGSLAWAQVWASLSLEDASRSGPGDDMMGGSRKKSRARCVRLCRRRSAAPADRRGVGDIGRSPPGGSIDKASIVLAIADAASEPMARDY
jgi:hypothetical protein